RFSGKFIGIDENCVWHKNFLLLCLNPNASVNAIPSQVVGCAVQNRCLEPVWGLEFEIEQTRFRSSEAVLGLRWNEHHIAGTNGANSIRCFDAAIAFDDEVKVLAVFVQVKR